MTTQKVQLAIKATPEQIWEGLTDSVITPAYYLGFTAEFGKLSQGEPYRYTAGGRDMITGTVVQVEAGRSLTTTFNGHWEPGVAALPESSVTFALFEPFMPLPGVTFLSVEHHGLPDTPDAAHLQVGWVTILSGFKTLLETGAPLTGAPRG